MPKETNRNTSIQCIDTRSYSDIRKLIRHAYLFGTYSDSDYLDAGLINTKLRQLKYMWSNISTYFDINKPNEKILLKEKIPERKKNKVSHRIFIDSYLNDGSFIASTYKHFSLTKNDILYCLYFLLCFGQDNDDNPYLFEQTSLYNYFFNNLFTIGYDDYFDKETLYDQMEGMWRNNQSFLKKSNETVNEDDDTNSTPFSLPTLNKFLNELTEIGLLESKLDNKKCVYKLSSDILDYNNLYLETRKDIINQLILLVQYFCNIEPFVIPGYYILDKLSLLKNNNTLSEQEMVFHFTNSNFQNMVDDDIIWSLFEYIDENKPISYYYSSQKGKSVIHNVLPMRIIEDYVYGRQYLFGYGYNNKAYIFHRIDLMENIHEYRCEKVIVTPLLKYSESSKTDIVSVTNSFCSYHLQKSWNVVPFNGKYNIIKIDFDFTDCVDMMRMYYIKKLYTNPLGEDIISMHDEGHYSMNIQISSIEEIIPWVHSFSCYAKVDKNVCPKLYEIIKKQSREILQLYEII